MVIKRSIIMKLMAIRPRPVLYKQIERAPLIPKESDWGGNLLAVFTFSSYGCYPTALSNRPGCFGTGELCSSSWGMHVQYVDELQDMRAQS